ncbi:hypothetical protein NKH77_27130 [Streptomyces sp. M19]
MLGAGEAVLLQLHRGHGYHTACHGNVIAYGADAESAPAAGLDPNAGLDATGLDATGLDPAAGLGGVWSAQFVGTAWLVTPTPPNCACSGPPAPRGRRPVRPGAFARGPALRHRAPPGERPEPR